MITGLSLKKNIEQCCISITHTDGEKGFNTLNEEIQVRENQL